MDFNIFTNKLITEDILPEGFKMSMSEERLEEGGWGMYSPVYRRYLIEVRKGDIMLGWDSGKFIVSNDRWAFFEEVIKKMVEYINHTIAQKTH